MGANNTEFLYSTGPQSDGAPTYGGVGSAAFFGIQNELLRRAAMAEAQRQQQLAEQRQAEQDALDKRVKEQQIAASQETIDTNKMYREAQAAKDKAAANAAVLKLYTAGQKLTPEAAAKVQEAGGQVQQQTEGTNIPAEFAAAPAQLETPELTNAGTPDQQLDKKRADFAQTVYDALKAKADAGEELTPLEQEHLTQAQGILMTGKATNLPAGIAVPKKGSEHHNTPEERFYDLQSRKAAGEQLSTEDETFLTKYAGQHPDAATKQADRIVILNQGAANAEKRRTSHELFQQKQKLRADFNADAVKLTDAMERIGRANRLLNTPNFVSDAVAAPELLQILAGGMGSGLRMTDAELNRINDAQTKLDQYKGKLAKWFSLDPKERVTIQNEMRAQMKDLIKYVSEVRDRESREIEAALTGIEDADSAAEVDKLRSDYLGKKREAAMGATKPAAGAPASKFKVTVE